MQLKRFHQRPGCPKAKQEEDTSYGFYAVFPLRITYKRIVATYRRWQLGSFFIIGIYLPTISRSVSLSLSLFYSYLAGGTVKPPRLDGILAFRDEKIRPTCNGEKKTGNHGTE